MQVYLAAYETQYSTYRVPIRKEQNIFCTYYYKDKTEATLRDMKAIGHKGMITIDSGAHSFFAQLGMSAVNHGNVSGKIQDPYEYFEEYFNWVMEWKDYFTYFVDLDIQDIVGLDTVRKWRQRFIDAGVGHKMITVWHTVDGWKNFERQVAESVSNYVGVEGLRSGKEMLPYNKFIKYAYTHDCKVHGFAFTKPGLLHKFPFYSVDSSSWTYGIRFGAIYVWEKNKLLTINTGSDKHLFAKYGIDPNVFHSTVRNEDSCRQKLMYSANAYWEMQEYFTKLWEKRGIHWKD